MPSGRDVDLLWQELGVVAPTETEETHRPVYDVVQGTLLGGFHAGREGRQGCSR